MTVYYSGPQSFIKTFTYLIAFKLWGQGSSVQTFKPLTLIYRSFNFVYCNEMYINLSSIVLVPSIVPKVYCKYYY